MKRLAVFILIMSVLASFIACEGMEDETSSLGGCDENTDVARCHNGYLYHCEDGEWVMVRDCYSEGLKCFVNCPIRGIGSDGGCAE